MPDDETEYPILDGTVDELEEALPAFEGDLEALLEAEKTGKNRKTAIALIEQALSADAEEVDEGGSGFGSLQADIQDRIDAERTAASGLDLSEEDLHVEGEHGREYIRTGIPGFDNLFDHGIPAGVPILLAGGTGSGKTIFGLQLLAHHAAEGEKCLFMSFEENEEHLKQHMRDFGWDPDTLIEEGNLRIEEYSPFDITRKVEAALAKEQGELMIDIDPVIMPEDFDPDFIVVDSMTAIASAFLDDKSTYRIYLDQLFDFFEDIGANSFLITETGQDPTQFSPTGVEEFLADGVIVFYNLRRGNIRESAIEVLKMRGESHRKQIVAMQITDDGITVYPDQKVFGAMG